MEFNTFFEILLKRTQSVTRPAPGLFLPLGELPEGRQGGLAAPQMPGGGSGGGEGSPLRKMPLLSLCQTHCQAAAELGRSWENQQGLRHSQPGRNNTELKGIQTPRDRSSAS